MKEWYQHRIEEVDYGQERLTVLFFNCHRLSQRLRRFLFRKAFFGGVRWTYSDDVLKDWRWIYSTIK